MPDPSVLDHYRASGEAAAPGVYRVVGVGEEVTLLRVTDGSGRRRSTGRVVRVAHPVLASSFEPAEDPDRGVRPRAWLGNALSGLVWTVRRLTGL